MIPIRAIAFNAMPCEWHRKTCWKTEKFTMLTFVIIIVMKLIWKYNNGMHNLSVRYIRGQNILQKENQLIKISSRN